MQLPVHSFLMLGQSNMAGRGCPAEVDPIDTARIQVLRNGCWQDMFVPVNPDRSFSGISLAESFARCYADDHPEAIVGLIPCADGGTSLCQWERGQLLFDHAVYQSRLAARTSRIMGVLWHQGEGDCPREQYPLYQHRLTGLIAALRAEPQLKDVPFVLGELGEFLPRCLLDENLVNFTHINRALAAVARSVPLVGLAPAAGLTANADLLHFDARSLREFGKRYYQAYKRLTDRKAELS